MSVRMGTVSSVDASGMVAVNYGDLGNTTQTLPVLNQSGINQALQPGDKVIVNHLDSGSEGAVVMGKLFNQANPAPQDGQTFPLEAPITMNDIVTALNDLDERVKKLEGYH